MLEMPSLLVNFKTYPEASGLNCAEIAGKILIKDNVYAIPQAADMHLIEKNKIAQHVDPLEAGRNTGSVLAQTLKHYGCVGSLINHSEKPVSLQNIKKTIHILRGLNMISIVCTPNIEHLKKASKLKPDVIAYEPPELIAGKISVSMAKPSIIKKCVKSTPLPIIVGAGIRTDKDVKTAMELGAAGVLVSSGVVKAKNPQLVVKQFLKYL